MNSTTTKNKYTHLLLDIEDKLEIHLLKLYPQNDKTDWINYHLSSLTSVTTSNSNLITHQNILYSFLSNLSLTELKLIRVTVLPDGFDQDIAIEWALDECVFLNLIYRFQSDKIHSQTTYCYDFDMYYWSEFGSGFWVESDFKRVVLNNPPVLKLEDITSLLLGRRNIAIFLRRELNKLEQINTNLILNED